VSATVFFECQRTVRKGVTNGYADLRGFPREAIEALSTRSREIGNPMERHGVSSGFPRGAASQTAPRARPVRPHSVRQWWRRPRPSANLVLPGQSFGQLGSTARLRMDGLAYRLSLAELSTKFR
jgi:hypothetical protein